MAILNNSLKRNFTQIPNAIIVDDRLSAGALRAYCYLVSKPDKWTVNNTDVSRQIKVSPATVTKYWAELMTAGWITRNAVYVDGKMHHMDYEIITTLPKETLTHTNLLSGNLLSGNHRHIKKDSINNEFSNKDVPEPLRVPAKPIVKETKKRKHDIIWDTIVDLFFPDGVPKSGQSRIGKVTRDLKSLNTDPVEIKKRYETAKRKWEGIAFGPEALVKNWSQLGVTSSGPRESLLPSGL